MSTISIAPQIRPTSRAPRRPARAQAQARSGQARLTRRGRLVVLLAALLAVAAFGIWVAAGSVATHEQGSAATIEVVTVAPGDTLWDIASDAAAASGSTDVRDMMDRIQQLNTLDGSVVYVGQELRVPTGD